MLSGIVDNGEVLLYLHQVVLRDTQKDCPDMTI